MAWTGLVFYNGLSKNPTIELCITVGIIAFLQLQRKTSRLILLAVYCVCRLYQPDVISDVSERRTVQLSLCTLPGNQYKLVSHIWTMFRISIIIYIRILIYSDYHLFWSFCVLICYYVYHCVHSVLYIMCLHKCNYNGMFGSSGN